MKPILGTILFLLAFASIACSPKTAPTSSKSSTPAPREKNISLSTMSADIINGVNNYRKTKGLAPLKLLAVATSEAAKHSSDMAGKKVGFGHAGFNQRALNIANVMHGTSATGENVAYGKMTWKEVIDAWLKSPDHRANIEGRFDYTGVGVAKNSQGLVYYTQIFVKK